MPQGPAHHGLCVDAISFLCFSFFCLGLPVAGRWACGFFGVWETSDGSPIDDICGVGAGSGVGGGGSWHRGRAIRTYRAKARRRIQSSADYHASGDNPARANGANSSITASEFSDRAPPDSSSDSAGVARVAAFRTRCSAFADNSEIACRRTANHRRDARAGLCRGASERHRPADGPLADPELHAVTPAIVDVHQESAAAAKPGQLAADGSASVSRSARRGAEFLTHSSATEPGQLASDDRAEHLVILSGILLTTQHGQHSSDRRADRVDVVGIESATQHRQPEPECPGKFRRAVSRVDTPTQHGKPEPLIAGFGSDRWELVSTPHTPRKSPTRVAGRRCR